MYPSPQQLSVATLVLLLLLCLLPENVSARLAIPSDTNVTDGIAVDVILCADDGTFSGMHELRYIVEKLTDTRPVDKMMCQSAVTGNILTKSGDRIPALIVTSGIGTLDAVTCTLSVLNDGGYNVKSMTWVGTAGFSPYTGGFNPLDAASGCDGIRPDVEKTAIGDVCVTSAAYDMACGICKEEVNEKSECGRPNCEEHDNTALFGRCSFTAPVDFAKEMTRKAQIVVFPDQPSELYKAAAKWWSANEAAMDPNPPLSTATRVRTNCAEATMNQFTVGARNDYLCREYTSAQLSKDKKVSPAEVVCVQAMEGMGFLRALAAVGRLGQIPAAIVRGSSDYDYYPLSRHSSTQAPKPWLRASSAWAQNLTYVSDDEYQQFLRDGYHYAIHTSNLVVLEYFDANY